MTIHAAKGLEFDVVAVADLGRRPPVTPPLLLVDGERVGVRLSLLDGARAKPALDYPALEAERRARDAAEEERILYVALTRAKRRLILSGTVERWSGTAPLVWLGPALVEDLAQRFDAVADGDTEAVHDTVVRAGFDVALTISAPSVLGRALRREWAAPRASGAGPPTARPADPGTAMTDPAGASAEPASPVGAHRDTAAPDPAGAPAEPAPPVGAHRDTAAPGPAQASAVPAQPAPRALSYSALAAYQRCGYRFYAQRVLGLPEQAPPADAGPREWTEAGPGRPDSVPAPGGSPGAGGPGATELDTRVRGIIVHALLEDSAAAAGAAAAERIRALAAREGSAANERDVETIQHLVAAFAGSPTGRRLVRAARVHREHEFSFELDTPGRPLLVGTIDALGLEADGTWLVIDVKTDRVDPGADLDAVVDAQYAIQRALYALAALRAGASRVEVVHLFLEAPDTAPATTYTPADAPRLEAAVARLVGRLAADEYPLTDRPHAALCGTCPARDRLCPYPRTLTLREDGEPPVT
ncbi:MAG: PD-(D/E)XK nuclease family protein [Solirubrobacterales bacterium]